MDFDALSSIGSESIGRQRYFQWSILFADASFAIAEFQWGQICQHDGSSSGIRKKSYILNISWLEMLVSLISYRNTSQHTANLQKSNRNRNLIHGTRKERDADGDR